MMKAEKGFLRKVFSVKAAALVVVIFAAAAGAWWYMGSKKAEIQYKTAEITRSDLRSVIQATGTLSAVESINVGTQISGTIKNIYIDYNSIVKQGQVIAEIDPALQNADVAQAQANLQSAKADLASYEAVLENARKNLDRTRELSKRDLIAKSDVDADVKALATASSQASAARAKIVQCSAALTKAQTNLGYTKIHSPVDGIVVAKGVEIGQTVAASYQTPTLAKIARDLKDMEVEVNVDEADIGSVKQGQIAEFTVDTFANDTFRGEVTQVRLEPTTSNNVVTYTVIVKVANEDGKLLPGMTANVSIITLERSNVLVAPNSAFRFKPVDAGAEAAKQGPPGPGGGFKRTVAEATKPALYMLDKKKPVKVEVEKGITDGQNTEVTGKVKEGDRVITGIIVQGDK